MPADTKAISYVWLMVANEKEAIVRFRWEPTDGIITSSMGEGTLHIEERNESFSRRGDDNEAGWHPVRNHEEPIPLMWVVAQNMARRAGFTVEIPRY